MSDDAKRDSPDDKPSIPAIERKSAFMVAWFERRAARGVVEHVLDTLRLIPSIFGNAIDRAHARDFERAWEASPDYEAFTAEYKTLLDSKMRHLGDWRASRSPGDVPGKAGVSYDITRIGSLQNHKAVAGAIRASVEACLRRAPIISSDLMLRARCDNIVGQFDALQRELAGRIDGDTPPME